MLWSQFPLTFQLIHNEMPPFIGQLMTVLCADWDCLCYHLKYVPWEDIFKIGASAAAPEFCERVQVGIDVYIPHRKYQIKPHSSPWFSAICAAVIVH